jgi:RNA polymerase sigma factor (sigma-70 family)
MKLPTVTELPLRMEPAGEDTFLVEPAPLPADRPASPSPSHDLEAIVSAARGGDDAAWTCLVQRFEPTLRRVARSFRLSPTDVDDVVQATWLRLFGAIERIREPAALPGWLTTTARREALRLLQGPVRERLTDDPRLGDQADADAEGPEAEVLAAERKATLTRVLRLLPPRQRELMRLLAAEPCNYEEISAALAMPLGSIGPTRARILARLEQHPEIQALRPDGP